MDGIPEGQALSFKTSGFGTPLKMAQIIHQACIKKTSIGNDPQNVLDEMEGKGISTRFGPLLDPRHAEILTATDHDTIPSQGQSPKLRCTC
ncbi:hypothetical protein BPOR_0153g00020 [Botrytis porri]|uniref:Uncharacterized protein n=1 Tax=Botrytis porri TaxID=87229 RepID=A0A4Z1KVL7_9HELO|nr:hypothetical protein BPOR_0153g00020 [Botrytis porri]